MDTRFRTTVALLIVLAGVAAAGLWSLDDSQQASSADTAAAGASPLGRTVAHAFPTAEAGFALRHRVVEHQ